MDYTKKSKIKNLFSEKGFPRGICFGSKAKYKKQNPQNRVIFNALIYLSKPYYDLLEAGELEFSFENCSKNYGKLEEYQVWHGDLDLTKSKKDLEDIAKGIGEDLVVTDEFTEREADIKKESL